MLLPPQLRMRKPLTEKELLMKRLKNLKVPVLGDDEVDDGSLPPVQREKMLTYWLADLLR